MNQGWGNQGNQGQGWGQQGQGWGQQNQQGWGQQNQQGWGQQGQQGQGWNPQSNQGWNPQHGQLGGGLFGGQDYIITTALDDHMALDVSGDPKTQGKMIIWKKHGK